jgi:hypothetical protein
MRLGRHCFVLLLVVAREGQRVVAVNVVAFVVGGF